MNKLSTSLDDIIKTPVSVLDYSFEDMGEYTSYTAECKWEIDNSDESY